MANAAIVIMALALSGCEAWAFKDYDQVSTSFVVITPDCTVEVHEGTLTGGPAVGTPEAQMEHRELRPDIDHEN